MAIRIAVWAPIAREPIIEALGAADDVTIAEATSATELLAALEGAQAVVMPGSTKFYTPEIADKIAASPDITWVQLISAGYDGVTEAGWPAGVRFTHTGGALSGVVAEHAFALLTALSRQIDKAARAQPLKTWDRPYVSRATTLTGATLAIVGFGSIGQRIAKIAHGYDMTVLGVSRSGRAAEGADEIHPASALLDVLPRADAVICALPYEAETRHVFNAEAFARFKPSALFVNIGRGGVVDQAALIAALKGGALAGAGLDVADPEPLPADDPLWDAPNLLITPHYAGAGDQGAAVHIAKGLMENLRRFRAGEALEHPLHGP